MPQLMSDAQKAEFNKNGSVNITVASMVAAPIAIGVSVIYNLLFTTAKFSFGCLIASSLVSVLIVILVSMVFPFVRFGVEVADQQFRDDHQKWRICMALFLGVFIGLFATFGNVICTIRHDKAYATQDLKAVYDEYNPQMEDIKKQMDDIYTRGAGLAQRAYEADGVTVKDANAAQQEQQLRSEYTSLSTKYSNLQKEANDKIESLNIKTPKFWVKFLIFLIPMILFASVMGYFMAPLAGKSQDKISKLVENSLAEDAGSADAASAVDDSDEEHPYTRY